MGGSKSESRGPEGLGTMSSGGTSRGWRGRERAGEPQAQDGAVAGETPAGLGRGLSVKSTFRIAEIERHFVLEHLGASRCIANQASCKTKFDLNLYLRDTLSKVASVHEKLHPV